MLRRPAGRRDMMITQRFDKREFLIGELEILVPNRPFRRRIEGPVADAGYWSSTNRSGANAGYRMTHLQQSEFPCGATHRQTESSELRQRSLSDIEIGRRGLCLAIG